MGLSELSFYYDFELHFLHFGVKKNLLEEAFLVRKSTILLLGLESGETENI